MKNKTQSTTNNVMVIITKNNKKSISSNKYTYTFLSIDISNICYFEKFVWFLDNYILYILINYFLNYLFEYKTW